MSDERKLQVFGDKEIRKEWNKDEQDWYVSIVDVIGILTDQPTQRGATLYWGKLKQRLKAEGSELLTNCQQLKLRAADGKRYKTDVANTKQLLRLIQSVPSPKAEPFKVWLAQLGETNVLVRFRSGWILFRPALTKLSTLKISNCSACYVT